MSKKNVNPADNQQPCRVRKSVGVDNHPNYERDFIAFMRRCIDSGVFGCKVCATLLKMAEIATDKNLQADFICQILQTRDGEDMDKLHTYLYPNAEL